MKTQLSKRHVVESFAMQETVLNEVVEDNVLEELQERIVKSFLDFVVLTELSNKPLSGYDVITLIYKKFSILLSSGTVYSLLYSLERNGLIKATLNQRRRDYSLTEKGRETVRAISNAREKIKALMQILL